LSYYNKKIKLKETYRTREEWWSRVFASPIAYSILHLIADWRLITPNLLTFCSFFLVLTASFLIIFDFSSFSLLAGIILQVAYIFDCMDGQLARYRGISSDLGAFLDKSLDYIKFPFVIFAFTYLSFNQTQSILPIVMGFSSLFFICFLPYLKEMVKNDFSILSWDILSKPTFKERNLRIFLFEEAQWYLVASICLLFKKAHLALWILFCGLSIMTFIQLIRVFIILRKRSYSWER
jgi:phosphatidylglycerophosphate synthase